MECRMELSENGALVWQTCMAFQSLTSSVCIEGRGSTLRMFIYDFCQAFQAICGV